MLELFDKIATWVLAVAALVVAYECTYRALRSFRGDE